MALLSREFRAVLRYSYREVGVLTRGIKAHSAEFGIGVWMVSVVAMYTYGRRKAVVVSYPILTCEGKGVEK